MQDALPIVVVAVVLVAGLVGVAMLFGSRDTYERIGRSGITFDTEGAGADADTTREEEIAQMLAASNARRAARGRPPLSPVAVRRSTSRPRSNGAFPVETGSLPPMPALRRFDVDELLTRPGTYFNPETEILLVVDDSATVDLELIDDEEDEGAEWILLGDDPAIDEHKRDELIESFETRRARSSAREDPDEDEVDEEDELEPDPDDEY